MSNVEVTQNQPIGDAVYQVENTGDMMGGGALTTIWRNVSKHRGAMYASVFLGVLSAALKAAPAAFAAMVVWQLQLGEQLNAIYLAIGMAFSALLSVVLFSASSMISHLVAAQVQAEIRRKIGEKLKRVPLGFFSRTSGADIKKVVLDDVETMEDGIAHLIPELSSAIAGPTIILLSMLILDWRLAIAALLPTILGFIAMSMVLRGSEELTNEFYRSQADIGQKMGEVVEAIPVVKTYNRGDSALKLAQNSFAHFKEVVAEWVARSMVNANWFFIFASSNLLFVTPLSLYLLHIGAITLPLFIFFNLAAMGMNGVISLLFGVMQRVRTQEGILARYNALMAEPELKQSEDIHHEFPNGHDIEFKNVTFGYDGQKLFEGLSFKLPAGRSLALVGPSGSGKSTIARLLARFWDIEQGQILIGGAEIDKITSKILAQEMSIVFQDVYLFTRSVHDNLRIGHANATEDEIIAAAKAANAHDFILDLPEGYNTILGNSNSLSVGQKQRISIARALLRDAPILVLDEATSFADPENENEVQGAISALSKGKTLIVVAHRLSTITQMDQILYVDHGKIKEKGTHEELLKLNGAYAKQWHAHIAAKTYQIQN